MRCWKKPFLYSLLTALTVAVFRYLSAVPASAALFLFSTTDRVPPPADSLPPPRKIVGPDYVEVPNYLPARGRYHPRATVTLTTQATYELLYHVEELCRRWSAPVSVAVYCPGHDFRRAARRINYLRQCGHPCLAANVTWHLLYDRRHAPSDRRLRSARTEPAECGRPPSESDSYRRRLGLTYPINVARNLARRGAGTRYLLASDVELYPSRDLVPRFLRMMAGRNASSREVFVLPVFEVCRNCTVPRTKEELVARMVQGRAVFFHRRLCDVCHRFPERQRWLRTLPPEDRLDVFAVTKRRPPWEPFYLGTNREPPFDPRFTWEGKMNKMPQVLEMCFLNYDFCVLDNAFLVHSPGIKGIDVVSERRRAPYANVNRQLYHRLVRDLERRYGPKEDCI